jgi:hypothetical protein
MRILLFQSHKVISGFNIVIECPPAAQQVLECDTLHQLFEVHIIKELLLTG